MTSPRPLAETVVSDVLADHPAYIRPFLDRNMLCVGCLLARFHSVAYACDKHDIPLEGFLAELDALQKGISRH